MDLFAILQSLRRHWVILLVVSLLTVLSAAGVVLVLPRHYEAAASYVLVDPAPAPSDAEIAADPALGEVNRNNPYLRFANQATVGQVLAGRVSADAVREALRAKGADPDYRIAPSADFGGSGQVLVLVGTGTSARQADETLQLLTQRMVQELSAMQKVYGADDSATITSLPVAAPSPARAVVSGTVRTLVGIVAAGVIVLFTAITIAEARTAGRSARGAAAQQPVQGAPADRIPEPEPATPSDPGAVRDTTSGAVAARAAGTGWPPPVDNRPGSTLRALSNG
jgi:Chain length determinant protein